MRRMMSLSVASRFSVRCNGARIEFYTMRSDSRHNSLCRRLPGFEGRGGEDAADDHARVHVPWLRLKAQLDRDAVLPCLAEQVVEFAERPDGKRAGRFQKHFKNTRVTTAVWVLRIL